jgi:hypothetical protein
MDFGMKSVPLLRAAQKDTQFHLTVDMFDFPGRYIRRLQ